MSKHTCIGASQVDPIAKRYARRRRRLPRRHRPDYEPPIQAGFPILDAYSSCVGDPQVGVRYRYVDSNNVVAWVEVISRSRSWCKWRFVNDQPGVVHNKQCPRFYNTALDALSATFRQSLFSLHLDLYLYTHHKGNGRATDESIHHQINHIALLARRCSQMASHPEPRVNSYE